MKDQEHNLQKACVNWFRMQFPSVMIYSIPNGGKRHLKTALKLKAEGAVAGVSDLFVMRAEGGFHGLFIEMKTESGKVSMKQDAFLKKADLEGYQTAVCRSFEDFRATVKKYLNHG